MQNKVTERDAEILKLMYDFGKEPYRSLSSYTCIREFTVTFPKYVKPEFVETFPKKLQTKFVADGLPPQHDKRKNPTNNRTIS